MTRDFEPRDGVFALPASMHKAREIHDPGKRGGRFYYTRSGKVRYGWPRRLVLPSQGEPPRIELVTKADKDHVKALAHEIQSWSDDRDPEFPYTAFSRRDIAGIALRSLRRDNHVGVVRDHGEAVGMYSIVMEPEGAALGMPEGDYLQLYAFATKRGGYGRLTLWHALAPIEQKGLGVVLVASPNAVKFYGHMGMHSTTEDPEWFYWTAPEVVAWRAANARLSKAAA